MAKVSKNVIVIGFKGKIGNIITRTRNGKTHAYMLSPRKVPLTENQISAQKKFAKAVAFAKEAMQDEDTYKKFVKIATKKGNESAYSAAFSWYLKSELEK
jgi:hypothetical protein